MLGVSAQHVTVLALALGLGYRYYPRAPPSYWDKIERWREEEPEFLTPQPMDQSMLYRSAEEMTEPLLVQAQGSVPGWLAGTLLRNGPGLFEFGEEKAVHAFDGMAMIRRYEAGPHAMNYSRRLIRSHMLRDNLKEQRYTKYGIGTPASGWGILDRLRALAGDEPPDNMVVHTVRLFGHYYATSEVSLVLEYDPVSLITLNRVDLAPLIPGLRVMTAHPLYDADGTLWNIGLATGPDAKGNSLSSWRYVVFKVGPPSSPAAKENPWLGLEIVAEIPSSRSLSISYLHSFFLTENYVIFTEMPWIIGDIPSVLIKHVVQGGCLGESMYWDGSSPLRFHVVSKATGQEVPIQYEADPMGFYHIINAYEERGHIVLDAPFKPTPVSYNYFMVEPLSGSPETLRDYMIAKGPAAGMSRRWVLPLNLATAFSSPDIRYTLSGRVEPDSYRQLLTLPDTEAKAWHTGDSKVYLHPELLAPPSQYSYHRALEFATPNPKLFGKKYRYAWGLGFPTGFLAGSIQKLDVEEKKLTASWEDPSCRATEPVFVPRPGGEGEQDGVLVFACLGTSHQEPTTSLVVLQPTDLTELGRFSVPVTTPVAFHGIWIPKH